MKYLLLIVLVVLLMCSCSQAVLPPATEISFSLVNPYIDGYNRYKVQLHAHTDKSDGVNTPAEVLKAYKNAGYDGVCLTDHDYLTPNPNVEGILYIPGVEETVDIHTVHIGATFNSDKLTCQEVVDEIAEANEISGLAHTFWSAAMIDIETLNGLDNFTLVEIENSTVTPTRANDYPFGELLSLGKRVWGIGVDDCHDINGNNFNKCFVEVMADELTAPALLESLRQGNFYVRETGGPQITLTVNGNIITCTSDTEADFEFLCSDNLTLSSCFGLSASYTVKGWEEFVRVRANNGHYSWSQPVWIESHK